MRDAYHSAHPLHLGIEVGVAEKAANECGVLILPDVHYNEAISSMAKLRQIEIFVAGEERRIPLLAQENGDLVILHPLAADIDSNLPRRYPGSFQQESLVIENVLIQNDQAWARWSTYSGAVYWAE
jgi:hypothetical protein